MDISCKTFYQVVHINKQPLLLRALYNGKSTIRLFRFINLLLMKQVDLGQV